MTQRSKPRRMQGAKRGKQPDEEVSVTSLEPPTVTREVYHGRDATGMHQARKSGQLGTPRQLRSRISHIFSSSGLRRNDDFDRYLAQEQVSVDAYHVDTGYTGTAPEDVLIRRAKQVGRKLTDAEIDARTKLISADKPRRRIDPARQDDGAVSTIEQREGSFTDSPQSFRTRGRRLVPDTQHNSPADRVRDWAHRSAIARAFLPQVTGPKPEQVTVGGQRLNIFGRKEANSH